MVIVDPLLSVVIGVVVFHDQHPPQRRSPWSFEVLGLAVLVAGRLAPGHRRR